MWEYIRRVWEMHVGRAYGPLSFRFIIQPMVAAGFAIRAGFRGRAGRTPCIWLGRTYRSCSPPRIGSGRRQALGKAIRCRRHHGRDLPNHSLSLDLSGAGFDGCNDGGCAFVFAAAGADEPARPALVPEQPQFAAKFRARKELLEWQNRLM